MTPTFIKHLLSKETDDITSVATKKDKYIMHGRMPIILIDDINGTIVAERMERIIKEAGGTLRRFVLSDERNEWIPTYKNLFVSDTISIFYITFVATFENEVKETKKLGILQEYTMVIKRAA